MKENKISVNGDEQKSGVENVKTSGKVSGFWFLYDTVIGVMNGFVGTTEILEFLVSLKNEFV